ncbi:MFS general substrate transporter [Mollisia scopiformis]|uniref:MFS general substrate transporter n=1 Tax=Mollisia scopiformis TaxID=149040 RepID=A0A194XFD1_MOLSC|nr:MFS general substrate transporter [Mollisia scopiformis]KUJ18477.1 MFS general substrate transporter [Mollisia scopiformis]
MEKLTTNEVASSSPNAVFPSTVSPEITTLPAEIGSKSSSMKNDYELKTSVTDVNEYVTGFKLVIIVASVAMACFLMLVDTMVINTAIPRITDQFHSLHDVGWYASAYQFGSAAPQPLTGKIYTHFNTKWTFLVFFGIFELGSVLCGAAVSSVMLIIGRAVAGLGAAGIINGAITIVSSCVPLEKRPGLIGITIGINQLGLIVGPLLGGVFTSYSTWRWCFYVNLPLGAVTVIAIILLRIPEQTSKLNATIVFRQLHHHLDLLGFALFAPAVLQLLLALQYGGNKYAWSSSQVIGLFCGAASTFAVWFYWNRYRGNDALLPHSMISRRAVWTAGLYQAFLMAAVYGAAYFLPIYFQAIKGVNAMLSGVYLLPTIFPQLFMAGSSGALISKIGYVIPLAALSAILLSTASGLFSILQPGSGAGEWVGFQIMAGVGSGAGLQVAIIAIQAVVSGNELSSAMAFIVFTQSLGPAIVLTLCNLIFDESLKSQLSQQVPHANTTQIITAGATGFRAIVDADDLSGVLKAYANSIDRVFYLVAAMAAMCGVVLWGMGWQDLRKRTDSEQQESEGRNDSSQS